MGKKKERACVSGSPRAPGLIASSGSQAGQNQRGHRLDGGGSNSELAARVCSCNHRTVKCSVRARFSRDKTKRLKYYKDVSKWTLGDSSETVIFLNGRPGLGTAYTTSPGDPERVTRPNYNHPSCPWRLAANR